MSEGSPFEPDRPASFPAGARCATHPEREAQRTCVRCGNYMCAGCISVSGTGMCLPCASRTGTGGTFPFSRDNYTFDGLLNYALARWKKCWLPLALATAAFFFVSYVPVFISSVVPLALREQGESLQAMAGGLLIQLVGQIVATVLQVLGQLALFGYVLDILENKPTSFARSFERVRALPSLLLQLLIVYLALAVIAAVGGGLAFAAYKLFSRDASIAVGALYVLALLPLFVYAGLGLAFSMLELVHEPNAGAIPALRTSWALAEGRRWSMAGVLFVSGLIAGIGVVACCVGVLASMPLGALLYGALYLALKAPGRANALPVTEAWPV